MTEPRSGPAYLLVGRIVSAHGLKGTLRVSLLSDFPGALRRRKRLFMGDELRPIEISRAQVVGESALVDVVGIDTVERAEAVRGQELFVAAADAVKPRRGEHFWHEIVGLRAVTTDGRELGTVKEILRTGANDVYVVDGPGGELLIPAIADVIQQIDPAAGRIVVVPVPGLLD